MVNIDFISESRYRFDRAKVRQAVETEISTQGVTSDCEVEVVVVGERKMKELHKQYLGSEEATDVISFPFNDDRAEIPFLDTPDGVMRLGEIVICYPVAVSQAAAGNKMVDDEIAFLAAHGCRHLLGIHHEDTE